MDEVVVFEGEMGDQVDNEEEYENMAHEINLDAGSNLS